MLISIQGNTIDTKDIYAITPIKGNECWSNSFGTDLTHSGYSFTVKLYNNKSVQIYLDGNDIYGDGYPNWWDTDYKNKLINIENKLNEFRNEIVCKWNESKNDIPDLKIDNCKMHISMN